MARVIPIKAMGKMKDTPVIEITKTGGILFHDLVSDRYFRAGLHTVEEAITKVTTTLKTTGEACPNDFYSAIGAMTTNKGRTYGWNSRVIPGGNVYYLTKTDFNGETMYEVIPFAYPIKEYKELI